MARLLTVTMSSSSSSLLTFLALAATTTSVVGRVTETPVSIYGRESLVNSTTCVSKSYSYHELAGYGYITSDAVDKFGDTLGGLGSGIHMDRAHWTKLDNGSYTGTLWSLPDRGW